MRDLPLEEMLRSIEETIAFHLPETQGELAPVREMLSYSLESGGKRVRPLLALLFCDAAGGDWHNALDFGAAVEYIHTYSLIHDDLPCMDNDDYRRGKLSSHNKFGEANALLAGDALLTHAFHILARGARPESHTADAVLELSRLAGVNGMIGGQYIDLAYENKAASAEVLFQQDALKTGALIEAACVLGCIAAGAGPEKISAARSFALNLGLAFQIRDDLLEYNDASNSDVEKGKATYVSVFGFEKAEALAREFTEKAVAALDVFGARGEALKDFAQTLLNRMQ